MLLSWSISIIDFCSLWFYLHQSVICTISNNSVFQWFVEVWWFSSSNSINRIDRHEITEILIHIYSNSKAWSLFCSCVCLFFFASFWLFVWLFFFVLCVCGFCFCLFIWFSFHVFNMSGIALFSVLLGNLTNVLF